MNNREILLGAIARCKARMEYGRDHSNGRDLQILCDCAEALLAEADKLEALGGWQPISTAPKDGTWVAAKRMGKRPFAVRFICGSWQDENNLLRDPTHFYHLPAQPKQGESNE